MKKRFVLALFAVASVAGVVADELTYPYLIFTQGDGTQTSVSVNQLEITFADGEMVVTNADGKATMSLAALASMQFSTSKDDIADGIERLPQASSITGTSLLYDLQGRQVQRRSTSAPLRRGVYVVRKSDGSTTKITLK